jgi:hypothetical protein
LGDAIDEGVPGRSDTAFAPRDLAFAGLFGAAAIALPAVFHLVQLGHLFMPMYLPLMTLPFFVRWGMAGLTALVVPILSALVTGMPPMMPPVAPGMALELSFMATALALLRQRWPFASPAFLLAPVLVAGRFLNAGLMYGASTLLDLPAGFTAGISFIAGWPGIILMMAVIPPIALLARRIHVR